MGKRKKRNVTKPPDDASAASGSQSESQLQERGEAAAGRTPDKEEQAKNRAAETDPGSSQTQKCAAGLHQLPLESSGGAPRRSAWAPLGQLAPQLEAQPPLPQKQAWGPPPKGPTPQQQLQAPSQISPQKQAWGPQKSQTAQQQDWGAASWELPRTQTSPQQQPAAAQSPNEKDARIQLAGQSIPSPPKPSPWGAPLKPTQPAPSVQSPPSQAWGARKKENLQLQKSPQKQQQSSSKSTLSITSAMQKLHISSRMHNDGAGDTNLVLPYKKKPGTRGRVIKVESNHLQLNLGNLETAYHYDVTIEPDIPKKSMRSVIDEFRIKYFPDRWPAFDGKKNLYTSSPLTNNLNDIFEQEIILNRGDEDDGKKFHVSIKFAKKVDLSPLRDFLKSPATPQEALQVVDIVLRMAPLQTCFPVARSFFIKPSEGIIDLGEGMEMYHGFYQSAIRGWKPLLNIDVAHKAFPKNINCIEALAQLISTPKQKIDVSLIKSLHDRQKETLEKFVKQLRISYEIPECPNSKKYFKCNGLGDVPKNSQFQINGRKTNVYDYFLDSKDYRIAYPLLPTLWVGNKQRDIKVPLELCTILAGQVVNRKATESQTSNMIRQASTNTSVRKDKIMRGSNQANHNGSPYVREFGFSIGKEFQKLDARVLEPPQLEYGTKNVQVQKGVWRNDKFFKPAALNRWTISVVCPSNKAPKYDELKNMAEIIKRQAKDLGMTLGNPTEPFETVAGRQSYGDCEHYFRSKKDKFDIIFVVVPDRGPQYSYVKKAAEIAVGCLTQCVKSNTVSRRMNPQTVLNILLKVNSKLNGINHTFTKEARPKILHRPCMIMGADVTHPGPDSKNLPSVAAVTGSHDPKAFKYNLCWRLQNPTVEIIADLEAIVIEQLKFYYKTTMLKPETIVFFRDGVSEGQFEKVKNEEIRAIRSACKKMQPEGYEPKITFLVVQKRHHTRLFPVNQNDSEDKNYNVPPGTCIDSQIVHPFLQDFYLVSHASIQGVAKPTKYCTLWDDNDLTNDEVEQLTYYLCHMFARCNRSVSYPTPTYYAHLAAARAKVYIETEDHLDMEKLNEEFKRFQIQTSIQKDCPMFFV